MPILWRYILKQYFKVFFLCIGAFISILLVMRSQEIARFATLNSEFSQISLFILYQLPYILPFAIPISGLISSTILMQQLSHTHELTALRACGCQLRTLCLPIILSGLCLSLLNFLIISEISPRSKLKSISLLHDTVSDNPLSLFRKNKFLIIKNSFVDMKLLEDDKHAKDLFFAFLDPSSQKLSLIMAKNLFLEKTLLKGSHLSMISSLQDQKEYDDLLIENQREMSIESAKLSSLLKKSHRRIRYEQLPTKLCLIKMRLDSPSHSTTKKGLFEFYKRAFFTLIPFTFVVLGTCFGMQIGRNPQKNPVKTISFLTTIIFICYLLGKTLHKKPTLALIVYLIPQIIIFYLSFLSQRKVQRGIE